MARNTNIDITDDYLYSQGGWWCYNVTLCGELHKYNILRTTYLRSDFYLRDRLARSTVPAYMLREDTTTVPVYRF